MVSGGQFRLPDPRGPGAALLRWGERKGLLHGGGGSQQGMPHEVPRALL